MKKLKILLGVLLLTLIVTPVLAKGKSEPQQAKGPWVAKVEGNGYFSGGSLKVDEANLGWNFKVNSSEEYNGQLNILEKIDGQVVNHFKLFGYQVKTSTYNCDTHKMRVEGLNDEGYRVAAHFRGYRNESYPNSIWY